MAGRSTHWSMQISEQKKIKGRVTKYISGNRKNNEEKELPSSWRLYKGIQIEATLEAFVKNYKFRIPSSALNIFSDGLYGLKTTILSSRTQHPLKRLSKPKLDFTTICPTPTLQIYGHCLAQTAISLTETHKSKDVQKSTISEATINTELKLHKIGSSSGFSYGNEI